MTTNSQLRDQLIKWSNRVRATFSGLGGTSSQNDSSSQLNLVENSSSSNNSRTTTSDYTELMGGSIPCPSCKGSGLIPKELEGTLVALIPVNDERLKPKKTWMYILLWIGVCILIGGGLLFLLMPRTVTLNSDLVPIEIVNVYARHEEKDSFINFYFMNMVNISSGNYLPVSVTNITATIISKFQPWSSDVVGYGLNETFSQITLWTCIATPKS
uniref:Transmembrane protein n=1 Tax=Ditylenchus dipsaci TaxID=166011 RepID=A0A915CP90_9BILA